MRLLDNASSCSVELWSNSPYPYSIKPILFSRGSSREWIRKGRISRDREEINLKKEGKEKKKKKKWGTNKFRKQALQQISHLPFLPSWLPQDRNPLYNPALKSLVVLPHQQSILTFSVPLNSSVRSWILWSIKKLLGCFFFFKWAFSCFSASWNHQWSKFALVTCANNAFLPVIHKHFF